jgi:hypothetical protein
MRWAIRRVAPCLLAYPTTGVPNKDHTISGTSVVR